MISQNTKKRPSSQSNRKFTQSKGDNKSNNSHKKKNSSSIQSKTVKNNCFSQQNQSSSTRNIKVPIEETDLHSINNDNDPNQIQKGIHLKKNFLPTTIPRLQNITQRDCLRASKLIHNHKRSIEPKKKLTFQKNENLNIDYPGISNKLIPFEDVETPYDGRCGRVDNNNFPTLVQPLVKNIFCNTMEAINPNQSFLLQQPKQLPVQCQPPLESAVLGSCRKNLNEYGNHQNQTTNIFNPHFDAFTSTVGNNLGPIGQRFSLTSSNTSNIETIPPVFDFGSTTVNPTGALPHNVSLKNLAVDPDSINVNNTVKNITGAINPTTELHSAIVNNINANERSLLTNNNPNNNNMRQIGCHINLNTIAINNIESIARNVNFGNAANKNNIRTVGQNFNPNTTAINNLEVGVKNNAMNNAVTHTNRAAVNAANLPTNICFPNPQGQNFQSNNNSLPFANIQTETVDLPPISGLLNSRYKLIKMLGKGSFGKVFQSFDCLEQKYVALKIIISDNNASITQSLIEKSILQELNLHDRFQSYVVCLLDDFMWNNHRCLVFELLNMNLYELIQMTHGSGLDLNTIKTITFKLLLSLTLLFDLNIIHCDLKPENIMVTTNCEGFVKLVDFGSSCKVGAQIYSYIQSRFYRAPEVMLELNYSKPIDVWSLGCLLAEMSTCEPLFCGRNEVDQMAQIIHYLGFPPVDMIANSKKAHKFFVYNPINGTYTFAADKSINFRGPFSKSLKDYLLRNKNKCTSNSANENLLYKGVCGLDDSFENFIFSTLNYNHEKRANPFDLMFHPFIFNVVSLHLNIPYSLKSINYTTFCAMVQQYRCSRLKKSSSNNFTTRNRTLSDVSFQSTNYFSNNFINSYINQPQISSYVPATHFQNSYNVCDNAAPLLPNGFNYCYPIPKETLIHTDEITDTVINPNIQSIVDNNIKLQHQIDNTNDLNTYFTENNVASNSPSTVTPCISKVLCQPLVVKNNSQNHTKAPYTNDASNILTDPSIDSTNLICGRHIKNNANVFHNQLEDYSGFQQIPTKRLNSFLNHPNSNYEDKADKVTYLVPRFRLNPIQVVNNIYFK